MEFRLNKVDPEVRQRVKDTTKSGKVHTKTGITIDKDSKQKQKEKDFKSQLQKYKDKKNKGNFSVQAVKAVEVNVPAYKDEDEIMSQDDKKGSILDLKL